MSESELMEVEESVKSEAESETSSQYSGPIGVSKVLFTSLRALSSFGLYAYISTCRSSQ